ncbi:hypothetical protein CCOS865_04026 [Pseudomonas reidholzensis]|uniref:Antitoxin Xre/MbcA/ParS-like toxin-binding domain-containing protein n=1 Tax=Pseudomonas reidholzensis TaxID=1785162 RepID=A0A383RZ62_9PSED|nr:hypothetical protein [Pseudomonas reidholzensis]SYX91746.1 hypothetical protein CCOS865_04026 [Pseudomonas reidholzensis]
MPKKPVTSTKLIQAQMHARAKAAVLQSGDWLTAVEVAGLAELSSTSPVFQSSDWVREKRVFAIRHDGVDYFPIYGLDETNGYRPLSQLKDVISVLEPMKDGWQMAYWFLSVNSWLGGTRPQDLLRSDVRRVIDAAGEEVSENTQG